jgi:hypothetical protein
MALRLRVVELVELVEGVEGVEVSYDFLGAFILKEREHICFSVLAPKTDRIDRFAFIISKFAY